MPGLDGTGPQGQGSLTGRGMGQCAGSSARRAGFRRGGFGFAGRRRRAGRFCPWFGEGSLEEEEKDLEMELDAVRKERELKNKE